MADTEKMNDMGAENGEPGSSVDTSWIKEEPVDEELYVTTVEMAFEEDWNDGETTENDLNAQSIHRGEGSELCVKRKHESSHSPPPSGPVPKITRVKEEPMADHPQNAMVDPFEISAGDVKVEDEESRSRAKEGAELVMAELQRRTRRRKKSLLCLKLRKCVKCAKVFRPLPASKRPFALQKFCGRCQPSVSITCKYCGKHFEHHKLYSRHVKECNSECVRCRHCHDAFSSEQQLARHNCSWTQTVRLLRFVCPICSEGFEKNKTRNTHKAMHVSPNPLKCPHCLSLFENMQSYQEHLDIHLVIRQFICTFCCKSFESKSLFDADQDKHKIELGREFEIKPTPDFVYICKGCKNWYPTLLLFESHECQSVSIKDPSSLTNVVLRALDFGRNADTSPKRGGSRLNKIAQSLSFKLTAAQPSGVSSPTTASSPDASKNKVQTLGAMYTCQLCQESFTTAADLGYHSCLVKHTAFDSDSEDEDELGDGTEDGASRGINADNHFSTDHEANSIEWNEYAKLRGRKVDFFSEIRNKTKPPPHIPKRGKLSTRAVVQVALCYMCGRQVSHNFAPCVGDRPGNYLCTLCLHAVERLPMYTYKCSKCFQKFPTLARLHMHMPWHKDSDGKDQMVFRKPRLSCLLSGGNGADGEWRHAGAELGRNSAGHGNPSTAAEGQSNQIPAAKSVLSTLLDSPLQLNHRDEQVHMDASVKRGQIPSPHPVSLTQAKGNILNQPLSTISVVPMQGQQQPASNLKTNLLPVVCPVNANTAVQPMLPNVNDGRKMNSVPTQNQIPVPLVLGNQSDAGNLFAVTNAPQLINVNSVKGKPCNFMQVVPVPVQNQETSQQRVQLVQIPSVLPVQSTGTASRIQQSPQLQLGSIDASAPKPQAVSVASQSLPGLQSQCGNSVGSGISLLHPTNLTNNSPVPMKISSVIPTGRSSAEVTVHSGGSQQAYKVLPNDSDNSKRRSLNTGHVGMLGTSKEHPRGYFLCNSCNMLCSDMEELKKHGCNIQAYCCHVCNAQFDGPEKLYKHQCKLMSFVCQMCQRSCSSPQELNQHSCIMSSNIQSRCGMPAEDVAGSSMSQRSHICAVCGKELSTRTALYVHRMRHGLKQ